MTLHIFDIIMGALFLLLVIRGLFRGFITEIMSMAAVIAAIAAGVFLSGPAAEILKNVTTIERGAQIITFAGLFIAIFFIVKIIETILHKVFERLNLKQLDRLLGLALGLVEGFLLVCLIVFLLSRQPFISMETLETGSIVYRFTLQILPFGAVLLKEKAPHV